MDPYQKISRSRSPGHESTQRLCTCFMRLRTNISFMEQFYLIQSLIIFACSYFLINFIVTIQTSENIYNGLHGFHFEAHANRRGLQVPAQLLTKEVTATELRLPLVI